VHAGLTGLRLYAAEQARLKLDSSAETVALLMGCEPVSAARINHPWPLAALVYPRYRRRPSRDDCARVAYRPVFVGTGTSIRYCYVSPCWFTARVRRASASA